MTFYILHLLFQVPAFKDGNVVVNESYAACFYLEVRRPRPLLNIEPVQIARFYHFLFYVFLTE